LSYLDVVSFVGKEDSAVRHQRPEVSEARADGISQVGIAKHECDPLGESGQRVLKIAFFEFAYSK